MTDSQRTKEEIYDSWYFSFVQSGHSSAKQFMVRAMQEYASQEVSKAQEGGLREVLENIVKFDDCAKWDDPENFQTYEALIEKAKQALSSPQPKAQQGIRWVKASERLPEKEGHYFVKWFNKTTTDIDTRYWNNTPVSKTNWIGNVHEWLDESDSEQPEKR